MPLLGWLATALVLLLVPVSAGATPSERVIGPAGGSWRSASGLLGHQDSRAQASRLSQIPTGLVSPQQSRWPANWCGDPTAIDRPTLAEAAGLPSYKVIYVYPQELASPERQAYMHSLLQSSLGQLAGFVAQQSGQRKTLRLDMGSSCGRNYLDIQDLVLPGRVEDYLYGPTNDYPNQRWPWAGWDPVWSRLEKAMAGQRASDDAQKPLRNFIIYLDGFNIELDRQGDGSWRRQDYDWNWGYALMYGDDSADPQEQDNLSPQGLTAFIYGAGPQPFPDQRGLPTSDPSQGFGTSMMAHEVFHTLGAVQKSAPHATNWLHCRDSEDIMCYRDSNEAKSEPLASCPPLSVGVFSQALDCGQDDYFSPNPAPGSYLASHWNTFSSPFLGSCLELIDACDGRNQSLTQDQLPAPKVVLRLRRQDRRWLLRAQLRSVVGRGAVRRVVFFRDGQRIARDYKSPYQATVPVRARRQRLSATAIFELGPPARSIPRLVAG